MPSEPVKKRSRRSFLGLTAVAALLLGTAGLLYLVQPRWRGLVGAPIVVSAAVEPLPFPTEINANFLAQVERCLIPVAEAYDYTLRVTSGYRTVEEQNLVFEQGRTENGHIVTEVAGGRSLHNFGLAVDVVDRWHGYGIDWERLGRIGAYCGLEQNDEGDQAHFTHRAGLTIEQLTFGYRPPPLALPCELLSERAAAYERLTRQDLKDCGAPEF